jgi:hypothetical protein
VPQAVPVAQKVTPAQPARRVTPKKDTGKPGLEADDKRERAEDDAHLYDLEA